MLTGRIAPAILFVGITLSTLIKGDVPHPYLYILASGVVIVTTVALMERFVIKERD